MFEPTSRILTERSSLSKNNLLSSVLVMPKSLLYVSSSSSIVDVFLRVYSRPKFPVHSLSSLPVSSILNTHLYAMFFEILFYKKRRNFREMKDARRGCRRSPAEKQGTKNRQRRPGNQSRRPRGAGRSHGAYGATAPPLPVRRVFRGSGGPHRGLS